MAIDCICATEKSNVNNHTKYNPRVRRLSRLEIHTANRILRILIGNFSLFRFRILLTAILTGNPIIGLVAKQPLLWLVLVMCYQHLRRQLGLQVGDWLPTPEGSKAQ